MQALQTIGLIHTAKCMSKEEPTTVYGVRQIKFFFFLFCNRVEEAFTGFEVKMKYGLLIDWVIELEIMGPHCFENCYNPFCSP